MQHISTLHKRLLTILFAFLSTVSLANPGSDFDKNPQQSHHPFAATDQRQGIYLA